MLEKRMFRVTVGGVHVAIVRDPLEAQARTMIARAREERGTASLRGSVISGSTVYVWDGWYLTHDEVQHAIHPEITLYSADLSTFDVTDARGFRYVKPGKYHPLTNRFVRQVIRAFASQHEAAV